MTVILANEIYDYLKKKILLPEVQMGCSLKSKRTGDLLFIAETILREVRMRKKNPVVPWTDDKKAYMVPYSWIVECLDMVEESE